MGNASSSVYLTPACKQSLSYHLARLCLADCWPVEGEVCHVAQQRYSILLQPHCDRFCQTPLYEGFLPKPANFLVQGCGDMQLGMAISTPSQASDVYAYMLPKLSCVVLGSECVAAGSALLHIAYSSWLKISVVTACKACFTGLESI